MFIYYKSIMAESYGFIFFVILSLLFGLTTSEPILACYNTEATLTCNIGQSLVIEEARFGFFGYLSSTKIQNDSCIYTTPVTCWITTTYYISSLCTGHASCNYLVQYSNNLHENDLKQKCAGIVEESIPPSILVDYTCVKRTLITKLSETNRLDADHVGGYLATEDYMRSIESPEWKELLGEEMCLHWNLPHVFSFQVPLNQKPSSSSIPGLLLRLKDAGNLYRSSYDFDAKTTALQCPPIGSPCGSDFLRIQISTISTTHRPLTVNICPSKELPPYQGISEMNASEQHSFSSIQNDAIVTLGPIYDVASIDFSINLQLAHLSVPDYNGLSRGWGKGLLFEYILLYCPRLSPLEGDGHIFYRFMASINSDETFALAEAVCPSGSYFAPPRNSTRDIFIWRTQLSILCDQHRGVWVPTPPSGCMTSQEIDAYFLNDAIIKTSSSEPVIIVPMAIVKPPIMNGNNGSDPEVILSNRSSAAVGAVIGFIFCLLVLLCILFLFRRKLIRFVLEKLPTETLPGRYHDPAAFMNTLSGSLTFSTRIRRNSIWRHPLLSQSASCFHIGKMGGGWSTVGSGGTIKHKRLSVPQANIVTETRTSNLAPCSTSSLMNPPPLKQIFPWPNGQVENISDKNLLTLFSGGECASSLLSTEVGSSDRNYVASSSSNQTQRQTLLSAGTATTGLSGESLPLPFSTTRNLGGKTFSNAEDRLPLRTTPSNRRLSTGFRHLSMFFRTVGGSISGAGSNSRFKIGVGGTERNSIIRVNDPRHALAAYSSSTLHADSLGRCNRLQAKRFASASQFTLNGKPQSICFMGPEACRLNHFHTGQGYHPEQRTMPLLRRADQINSSIRQKAPLPPIPLQEDSSTLNANLSPCQTGKKGDTLNLDTYLEPMVCNRRAPSPETQFSEDMALTEAISGGSLSNDSDTTSHQQTWLDSENECCISTDLQQKTLIRNGKEKKSELLSEREYGMVMDPSDVDFDQSSAEYFTYDHTHRQGNRAHNGSTATAHWPQQRRLNLDSHLFPSSLIHRPQLSPPNSNRNRPLSDAMLSNHYYDVSEKLSAQSPHVLQDNLHSHLSNDALYSNTDSLYEAVDTRRLQFKAPAMPLPLLLTSIVEGNSLRERLASASDTSTHTCLVTATNLSSPTPFINHQISQSRNVPYANLNDI